MKGCIAKEGPAWQSPLSLDFCFDILYTFVMVLRRYRSSDCNAIISLFRETVHTINRKDYSREQCDAWAPAEINAGQWDDLLSSHLTLVAIEGETIVGFADMDDTGYLDHLYVHADHQRRGIATALCDALEAAIPCKIYTTHASITARPFFEARGYAVVQEQQVKRHGVLLTNYIMQKRAP